MTRYDFTETTDFLNNSVPLGDLYEDVVEAMHDISEYRHLTRRDINKVWGYPAGLPRLHRHGPNQERRRGMSPYNSAGEYINRMYTPRYISNILCQAAVQLSVIDAGEEQYAIRDMQQAVLTASEMLTSFTPEELRKLCGKNINE